MSAGFLRALRGTVIAALALAASAAGAQAQVLASLPAEPGIVPKAEARPIAAWVTFC